MNRIIILINQHCRGADPNPTRYDMILKISTQMMEIGVDTQILVVEDEPSVGEVVQLYLRRAGFSVAIVRDGVKALEALESALPSLVILDLMLPGVDGWEIIRQLRARSDVPVIMLTARHEEIDRIAGLELG